jgi:hypothetical protein
MADHLPHDTGIGVGPPYPVGIYKLVFKKQPLCTSLWLFLMAKSPVVERELLAAYYPVFRDHCNHYQRGI